MNFIEVDFTIKNNIELAKEILYSDLEDSSCESMLETDCGYKAYFKEKGFDNLIIQNLPIIKNKNFDIDFRTDVIKSQNWNALWESNYSNVIIKDKINIRADYHETIDNIDFDIVINPKMSFGTAHHPTTSQILELILNEDLNDKKVLDMGCGTAVLSIFVAKAGSNKIIAIDNDEWAYKNSLENIKLNNVENIDVKLGDADDLDKYSNFDVVLANINRNILLNDMAKYSNVMKKNALVFFSGFYSEDLEAIKDEASKYSISYISYIIKENWVAAKFIKQ